eukprot:4835131-Alexandrium_andersonii.AAC.1
MRAAAARKVMRAMFRYKSPKCDILKWVSFRRAYCARILMSVSVGANSDPIAYTMSMSNMVYDGGRSRRGFEQG